MALSNLLLLSQIAGYVTALILSLCVVVPMSLHQDEFRGHCLLFSSGEWQANDGQLKVEWASQCYCNYTIFVGVVLFIASAIQIYRLSLFVYKGTDSSFLSAFIDVVSSMILCGMTIVAALMITLGFIVWCKNITQRFASCENAAGQPIDTADGINTDRFYIELGTAQTNEADGTQGQVKIEESKSMTGKVGATISRFSGKFLTKNDEKTSVVAVDEQTPGTSSDKSVFKITEVVSEKSIGNISKKSVDECESISAKQKVCASNKSVGFGKTNGSIIKGDKTAVKPSEYRKTSTHEAASKHLRTLTYDAMGSQTTPSTIDKSVTQDKDLTLKTLDKATMPDKASIQDKASMPGKILMQGKSSIRDKTSVQDKASMKEKPSIKNKSSSTNKSPTSAKQIQTQEDSESEVSQYSDSSEHFPSNMRRPRKSEVRESVPAVYDLADDFEEFSGARSSRVVYLWDDTWEDDDELESFAAQLNRIRAKLQKTKKIQDENDTKSEINSTNPVVNSTNSSKVKKCSAEPPGNK